MQRNISDKANINIIKIISQIEIPSGSNTHTQLSGGFLSLLIHLYTIFYAFRSIHVLFSVSLHRLTPTKIWQNRKLQYPTPLTSSTNKQNAKGVWRNFVPTTTRSRSSKWHQPKWSRSPLAWHTMQSEAVHSQKRKHLSSPKWSSTPSSSSTSERHQPIIVHKVTKNKKFLTGQTFLRICDIRACIPRVITIVLSCLIRFFDR